MRVGLYMLFVALAVPMLLEGAARLKNLLRRPLVKPVGRYSSDTSESRPTLLTHQQPKSGGFELSCSAVKSNDPSERPTERPKASRTHHGWEKVEKALLKYKSIEGNLLVPTKFTVPNADQRWAVRNMRLWNMKLGRVVDRIRNNNAYADHKDELVSMGFDFDPQANFYGWELSKKALLAYLDIHGDLLVNYRFTVPIDDERWAPELWKIKLGYVVNRIRNRNAYSEHKAELIEMGFDYEPQVVFYGWDLSRKALLIYKQIHGNLLVPYKFTVPSDDDRWTSDLWDMKLGRVVNRIRNSNDYSDHMDELVEMGFDFDFQWVVKFYDTMLLNAE